MAKPSFLIPTGFGTNCDDETELALKNSGINAKKGHINDIIEGYINLNDFQGLFFPGGFSYGDDTGSGNALANKIRNNYWDELLKFVEADKLVMGVCNGFQVMVNLGLLKGVSGKLGEQQVALDFNDPVEDNPNARYFDRWVDLKFYNNSPWTKGIDVTQFPIAHGEGKFFANAKVLQEIEDNNLVGARYVEGVICKDQNLQADPNGSLNNIACITNPTGRLIGLMPHPERALWFTQLPNWTLLKEEYKRKGEPVPKYGPGKKIFDNAREYFE